MSLESCWPVWHSLHDDLTDLTPISQGYRPRSLSQTNQHVSRDIWIEVFQHRFTTEKGDGTDQPKDSHLGVIGVLSGVVSELLTSSLALCAAAAAEADAPVPGPGETRGSASRSCARDVSATHGGENRENLIQRSSTSTP